MEAEAMKHEAAQKSIEGYFDKCEATGIIGWAADSADKTRHVEVEALADDRPIGRSTANMYRQDLADAGIGKGTHGFRIVLPGALFDGAEHSIEVRETSTGIALSGSPRKFKSAFADRCHIELEGSSVVGWVKLPEGVKALRLLDVQEGEKEVISATL